MKIYDKEFYLSKLPKDWIIKFEKYPGKRALPYFKLYRSKFYKHPNFIKEYVRIQTGYTDFNNKIISVRGGRSEVIIRKTILHEIAHAISGKQKPNTNHHRRKFYDILKLLVDEFDWDK